MPGIPIIYQSFQRKPEEMFDGYRFILASKSPRRYELLAGLDIEFKVETGPEAPEAFNGDIPSRKFRNILQNISH